jgi:hypothetical protein
MQSLASYLQKAAKFDKLAAIEQNKILKRRYAKIAKSYHALAQELIQERNVANARLVLLNDAL